MKNKDYSFATRAIHSGLTPDKETGALITPIYANTTYIQDSPGEHRGYEYSRTDNPTRSRLEDNLADLENGKNGLAFASGMASIDTVLNLLSSGDHVLAGSDVYGGTHRLFTSLYEKYNIDFSFVNTTDVDKVKEALQPNTELVWIESPTNPLLEINDISLLADLAHEYEALLAVDNTFATPYLQRPLEMGADIVSHSLTKYLGGHSDVVGGALVTSSDDLAEKLAFYQNSAGATLGPHASFLVLRGIKTLPLRMDKHCENARKIASWLSSHPAVKNVYYPGLDTHSGHELAKKQMEDFGGMISFELSASLEATSQMCSTTEIFTLAESLGGIESLIEQPATMTHASIPREKRVSHGLSDGLVRLSAGIEDSDDLIEDLEQAIDTALN